MAAKAYSYLRLSSDVQIRGDGLRRQLQASREYAAVNGLDLVEKDQLRELGVSAFRGLNATDGALAGFLAAVSDKRIEPGSYLLIESLDRLSRQVVMKSLGLFTSLLNNNIRVVTLADKKVYSADSDFGDLIMSIVSMQRSHEESAMKSARISASWAHKRDKIDEQIMTGKTKAWLRPRADKRGFDLIPARVKVVRQIFDMAADLGLGVYAITRILNELKTPSFAGNGWHIPSVLRLLHDRAVLGEFTPCQMVNGTSTPTNKVKADYFPPIVEEAVFHRVQAGLESRRSGGGGSKGAVVTNLFSKVVSCGRCGAHAHLINKGRPRGSRSLVCAGSKRGFTACSPSYWPYRDFERSALSFLRDKIDLAALTGDAADRQERDEADREVRAVEGRLAEIGLQRERVFGLILGDEATDFLKSKLRDLDAEVARLEKQLATLRDALRDMTRETAAFAKSKDEIAQLIDRVQSGAEDTFALRAALAARMRDLVAKIFLYPSPIRITVGVNGSVTTVHAARCFSVHFKNNVNRLVAPTDDDPARVIDTGNGRVVSATGPAVREELVRRYEAEPGAWDDFVLIEAAD